MGYSILVQVFVVNIYISLLSQLRSLLLMSGIAEEVMVW